MSLNMYLGEVHTQTQSMNAVCTATIQGMEQVIQSIDAFAIDTVLQGQTYSSAKSFFVQTFRPLAQGIIYLCEELIRQNDAFPSQFQSQVASTDVIEQEILEQIQGIDQTRANMEAIRQTVPIPGTDAMMGIFDMMKRKLQEKLEHLHEFNYTSSSNYDTALQLALSIARGLAEVQSGKGFSLASGTFSTQGLNMEWTTSIQAIEEGRKRQADKLLNGSSIEEGAMCGPLNSGKKDESLLDKFKHGVEDAYDDYSKIKYVIDDKIESTLEKAGLGVPYHYKKGKNEAMGDELLGFADAALHPIDTFNNTIEAISDPVGTFNAIKQTISDSWNADFVNGDLNSKAEWYGGASTHAMFAVAGTKGVDKAAKFGMLKAGTKLGEMSQAAKQGFQDTASLFNRNRNEFAIAGGNGIRFGVDTPDFRQTEEKLSTHQFANSGGNTNTNAIKPGDTSPLAPGGGLIAHEAKPGQRRGGHLIKKHVEKTDAELLQRLQSDPRIPASSSFTNRAIAERVANEVLSNPQNIAKINRWLNNPNSRPTLPLRYNGNSILGRYVERGSNGALDVENAVIVLKKDNQGSFIITGYPEK